MYNKKQQQKKTQISQESDFQLIEEIAAADRLLQYICIKNKNNN